jgi:hypothetical protein
LTRSYRFISEHRAVFGVTRLCRVLGVGPGFCEWLAAAPVRAERRVDAVEIAEVHTGNRVPTARPRVTAELR